MFSLKLIARSISATDITETWTNTSKSFRIIQPKFYFEKKNFKSDFLSLLGRQMFQMGTFKSSIPMNGIWQKVTKNWFLVF